MRHASDDTPRLGEMTDDQLDELLKGASADLLDHITATADSNRTLTAIMDGADQLVPAETPVSAMIRFRDAAHDIASALALVPTSADDIQRVHDRVSYLRQALIPDLASDPVRVLERTHDLGRTRGLVYDTAIHIAAAGNLANTRAIDIAYARAAADDLDLDLDLDIDIASTSTIEVDLVLGRGGDAAEISRAVRIIGIIDRYLGVGLGLGDRYFGRLRDLHRYLYLGRDVASDIGRAADLARASALDCAYAVARDLDSYELNASGEDLSGIEIKHLDALDGITWTRKTTWPPAIAGHVGEHSYEIQPGVYQVHLGDTRDRPTLLTLA